MVRVREYLGAGEGDGRFSRLVWSGGRAGRREDFGHPARNSGRTWGGRRAVP